MFLRCLLPYGKWHIHLGVIQEIPSWWDVSMG
jgi:hypothetical protein